MGSGNTSRRLRIGIAHQLDQRRRNDLPREAVAVIEPSARVRRRPTASEAYAEIPTFKASAILGIPSDVSAYWPPVTSMSTRRLIICTTPSSPSDAISTNILVMYVIREVLNCKPGKVRQMVEKFRQILDSAEGNGARTDAAPN